MKVESHERSTGMGVSRSTRVLVEGKWVKISEMPLHRYHGRNSGFHTYSVDVPEGTPVASFYRSNSGKEYVLISGGPEFGSFEDACRWAEEQGRLPRPTTHWLLNSSVIAAGAYGDYRYSPATSDDLASFLKSDPFESRIGYPETAAVIERWTGIRPEINRELSAMEPGDEAMVVRLRYRLGDPGYKGQPLNPADSDWEIARLERLK